MSREVRRIDKRFHWPLKDVWYGYILDPIPCRYCNGNLENCPCCEGEGCVFPKIDPPTGDGWQMWETCSEGSPISPVMDSPEELAQWLAHNRTSAFGSRTATKEEWLAMIQEGWAVCAVMDSTGLKSGVEWAGKRKCSEGET